MDRHQVLHIVSIVCDPFTAMKLVLVSPSCVKRSWHDVYTHFLLLRSIHRWRKRRTRAARRHANSWTRKLKDMDAPILLTY